MKTLSEYIKEGLLDDDFDVSEENTVWVMLIQLLGDEWNVSKNHTKISFNYALSKVEELVENLNKYAPDSNFNVSRQAVKVEKIAHSNKDVVLCVSVNKNIGFVGLVLNSWSGQRYSFDLMKKSNAPTIRCSQWTNGYYLANSTYYFKVPKDIARIIFEQNGTTF